jgi:hypothetical protein
MAKKDERKVIDKILVFLGAVTVVTLLAAGGVAWWASSFITNQVSTELTAQRIYFPARDSSALTTLPASDQQVMNQYAGMQLATGQQAKVYADNFIAVHLRELAGGKTYAEVSSLAQQNPTDQKLQQQKATLFQGETLRAILLNAYAFGTMGAIARLAAIIAILGGGVMLILVLLGLRHLTSIS